jgi:hypothetical protein
MFDRTASRTVILVVVAAIATGVLASAAVARTGSEKANAAAECIKAGGGVSKCCRDNGGQFVVSADGSKQYCEFSDDREGTLAGVVAPTGATLYFQTATRSSPQGSWVIVAYSR